MAKILTAILLILSLGHSAPIKPNSPATFRERLLLIRVYKAYRSLGHTITAKVIFIHSPDDLIDGVRWVDFRLVTGPPGNLEQGYTAFYHSLNHAVYIRTFGDCAHRTRTLLIHELAHSLGYFHCAPGELTCPMKELELAVRELVPE